MSTYAQFNGDGSQIQFASNLGWSEFGDWCDSLDAEKYPRLVQLWEHAESNDIQGLITDLETAMEEENPSEAVYGSAELLLDGLQANKEAEFVLITN